MTPRSPTMSTKTTTKRILEVSELLGMRLIFTSDSSWKPGFQSPERIRNHYPHHYLRGLQVSDMRISLALRFQETSREISSARARRAVF